MKIILGNRYLRWLVIIIVGLVLISYWFSQQKESERDPNLRIATVERADLIQRVTISGKIIPERQTIITAPYFGYVKKVFVTLGEEVKEDTPLVSVVKSLQTTETVYPIRAPYAGMVVQIQKSEGEFVKEGDPIDFIVEINDLSKLYVNAEIPEIDIDKVKTGQTAIIKANSILDRSYEGIVREISRSPKVQGLEAYGRSQVVYPVKIEITDKDERLLNGMTVIVDITTAERENVLVLPHEFIWEEGKQHYVLSPTGERKDITLGLQNEEVAEIVSGLSEGSEVEQVDYIGLGAK